MRTFVRFGLYALDTGLSAAFGVVLLMFVSRAYGLEDFGIFALCLAIINIQTTLVALGIPALLYSRAITKPVVADRLCWLGVRICITAGLITYLLTIAFLWGANLYNLLLLYSVAGLRIIGVFGEPLRAIYQARAQPISYVPIRVSTLSAAFGLSAITYYVDGELVWYGLIFSLEWSAFALILLLGSLRRGLCLPQNPKSLIPLVTKASPLFVQSVCVAIYVRFDQIYVGWRFGEADLGVYAAAARLAEAGNMLFGLIAFVAVPRIVREYRSGRLSIKSKMALSFIGLSACVASLVFLDYGGAFLSLIFGPDFYPGGSILAVYALSTAFSSFGYIGSRLNVAQGRTMPSMVSGLVGATSNVFLTILLCEAQGPIGAATATVISYAFASAIVWRSISNYKHGLV